MAMPIKIPSIIAARISSGSIIITNVIRAFFKFFFIFFIAFFWKMKVPSCSPIPNEINTAASSNIPWGRILHRENIPSD